MFSRITSRLIHQRLRRCRRAKYPDNFIAQVHRFIKQKARTAQRVKSFRLAERILEGVASTQLQYLKVILVTRPSAGRDVYVIEGMNTEEFR